jgi:dipeptidyl aminopeptidase/acylaminoacyl peptidase
VRKLPYVDAGKVGLVGNSHGGGMILKALAEMDVAAAIASEPDASEFLQMDPEKFGADVEFRTMESVAPYLNKDVAMQRIRRVNTPILMLGRDDDHLSGIFETAYTWMKEAGRNVEWISHDHPVHGYLIRVPKEDGVYKPDTVQKEAVQEALDFFGRHMAP